MDPSSSEERVPGRPIEFDPGGRGAEIGDSGASREQGPAEPIELNRAQSESNLEAIRNVRLAPGATWLAVLAAALVVLAVVAVVVL